MLNFKAAFTIFPSLFGFTLLHLLPFVAVPTASFELLFPQSHPWSPSLLPLSHRTSFLCPAPHITAVVRTGDAISPLLPLPHALPSSPPFISGGRLGALYVLTGEQSLKHWVCACMCVWVMNEERLEGRGDGGRGCVIDDDCISLHVSPALTAIAKATQFISQIHINVL